MNTLQTVLREMRLGHWIEAHNLVQSEDSALAAWLHGILHIQEGDLEDAEYWYDKANRLFRQRGTLEDEIKSFEKTLDELLFIL